MKQAKLNQAIYCLLAVAAVQILLAIYGTYLKYSFNSMYPDPAGIEALRLPLFDLTLAWPVGMVVLIYYVIKELRKETPWAWAAAIAIFLVASPSWAIPFCIFGLIRLLDEEVRTDFIKALEIKL